MKIFFLILSAIYANDEPLSFEDFKALVFQAMEAEQDSMKKSTLSQLFEYLNPSHSLLLRNHHLPKSVSLFYSQKPVKLGDIKDFRIFEDFVFSPCEFYGTIIELYHKRDPEFSIKKYYTYNEEGLTFNFC